MPKTRKRNKKIIKTRKRVKVGGAGKTNLVRSSSSNSFFSNTQLKHSANDLKNSHKNKNDTTHNTISNSNNNILSTRPNADTEFNTLLSHARTILDNPPKSLFQGLKNAFNRVNTNINNAFTKKTSNANQPLDGMGINTIATYVKDADGKEKLYDVVGAQIGSYPGDPNSSKAFFGTDDSKPSTSVQKEYLYKLNPDTDTNTNTNTNTNAKK